MNEKQENKTHKFNNVMFQKLEQYDNSETDTRFIKAKVWICHTGSNYNASYFSEESILGAMDSLANTPILCFYTTNKEGEDDFGGHEYQLEKTDKGFDLICKEYAIGVISETDQKTAQFEDRLCDDGIMRTFLTCTCTLWTKFNQAMNIFEEQNVKGQSMEITDVDGNFEDDNLYHINKFHFNGCTVLSNDCMPAMQNSTIEVNFSQQNTKSIAKEIENKLNEFAKYFSKKEEENNMAKKKIDETKEPVDAKDTENLSKKETTDKSTGDSKAKEFDANTQDDAEEDQAVVGAIEDVADKLDDIEDAIDGGSDEDTEDFAKKSKSDSKEQDAEDKGVDEDTETMSCGDKKEEMACGDKKKFSLNFELSYEDIRCQLYDKLWNMENIENTCYGIIKTMDAYFIYVDYCSGQFFEQAYTTVNDVIIFASERKELFNVFVDKETKDAIASVTYSALQQNLNEANAKIQEYSKANAELLKFQMDIKENERKAEIDKVISSFSTIDALDLENCRQKAYNKELNLEQVEEKLYAIVGKMNFSKKTENKEITEGDEIKTSVPTSYSVSLKESNDSKCPYAGCESLFSNQTN